MKWNLPQPSHNWVYFIILCLTVRKINYDKSKANYYSNPRLCLYELLNWKFPQGGGRSARRRDQGEGRLGAASLAFVLISRINYQETQFSLDFRRSGIRKWWISIVMCLGGDQRIQIISINGAFTSDHFAYFWFVMIGLQQYSSILHNYTGKIIIHFIFTQFLRYESSNQTWVHLPWAFWIDISSIVLSVWRSSPSRQCS